MKEVQIIHQDYQDKFDSIIHTCRGIILKEDKILLSYASKEDYYTIAGGHIEDSETIEECCKREVREETGIICEPKNNYLNIIEFYSNIKQINHYFLCDFLRETRDLYLTQSEYELGLCPSWVSLMDALLIFGQYEKFKDTNPKRYGLYKREFTALLNLIK